MDKTSGHTIFDLKLTYGSVIMLFLSELGTYALRTWYLHQMVGTYGATSVI